MIIEKADFEITVDRKRVMISDLENPGNNILDKRKNYLVGWNKHTIPNVPMVNGGEVVSKVRELRQANPELIGRSGISANSVNYMSIYLGASR